MTRQVTDNLYIELDYFTPEEYYTYEAVAASALTTESTINCDAEVIAGGEIVEANGAWSSEFTQSTDSDRVRFGLSDFITELSLTTVAVKSVDSQSTMSSEFAQSTIGSRVRDIDFFAFGDAAIAVQYSRIRDNNISVDVAFDIATDGRVFRDISSEAESLFSVDVFNERSRDVNLETQAAFSFAVDYTNIKQGQSDLTLDFTVSCEISHIESANIAIDNFASVTIFAERSRDNNIGLIDNFNLSSIIGKINPLAAELSVSATVACSITHIESFDIVASNFASLSIQSIKYTGIVGNIASSAGLTGSLKGIQQKGRAALSSRILISANGSIRFDKPWLLFGVTPNSIILNTADKKFGSASMFVPFSPTMFNPRADYRASDDINADNVAIDFWIKRSGRHADSFPAGLFEVTATNNPLTNLIYVTNTSDHIGVLLYGRAGLTGIAPPLNQWCHIALSMDNASSKFALWIDGTRATYESNPSYARRTVSGNIFALIRMHNKSIDELHVSAGSAGYLSTIGRDPESTTIAVPTEAYRPTENTVFLGHYDKNFDSDVSTQHFASASLVGEFTLFARPPDIVPAEATLVSTSSLSCQVNKNIGIDLTAFSNASLTVDFDKLKDFDSEVSSQVTATIDNIRVRFADTSLDNTFNLNVDANKITDITSDFSQVTSEITAVTSVTFTGNIALETAAEQIAFAATIYDIFVDVDALFDPSVTINAIRNSFAILDSVTAIIINAIKIPNIQIDAYVDSTLENTAVKITDVTSEQSILSSLEFSAVLITDALIPITASVDISINADRIRDNDATTSAEANTNVSGDRIRFTRADLLTIFSVFADGREIDFQTSFLAVVASLDIDYIRIRNVDIATESIASELVVVNKISDVIINSQVDSLLTVQPDKITGYEAALLSDSQLTSTVLRIKDLSGSIDADTTLSAIGRISIEVAADIDVEASLTALAVKGTEILLQAFSDASISVSIDRTRDNIVTFESLANTTLDISITRNYDVAMLAFASQLSVVGIIGDGIAITAGTFTLNAQVSVLHIDEYIYKIPVETRAYIIQAETRLRNIAGETRYYKIN
jgi:hypothetical protein